MPPRTAATLAMAVARNVYGLARAIRKGVRGGLGPGRMDVPVRRVLAGLAFLRRHLERHHEAPVRGGHEFRVRVGVDEPEVDDHVGLGQVIGDERRCDSRERT